MMKMLTYKHVLLWWAMVITLLPACKSVQEDADIVILYTTDVHGNFLAYDFAQDTMADYSLANVATYLHDVRRQHPESVVLLDAGDMVSGQPSSYYYNFVDVYVPHIFSEVYNYLQYDAVGWGRSDIELGEAFYASRFPSQLTMPMVCANAIDIRSHQPMTHPYVIIERQGYRIAVLSMISPDLHRHVPQSQWQHLLFQDMTDCARQWMPVLLEQERADVVVGLFQAPTGRGVVSVSDSTLLTNAVLSIAKQVPGFDVILFGQDHRSLRESVVNIEGDTVHLLQALPNTKEVGRVDLHLSRRNGRKLHKHIVTQSVPMQGVAPDSAFVAHFSPMVDKVNTYLDSPLGVMVSPVSVADALVGPSALVDLIHTMQMWVSGTDISLTGICSQMFDIDAGDFTVRDLFSLYSFTNQIYTVKMYGYEIEQYLEYGYGRQFNTMTRPTDHLLAFKYDDQGQILMGPFGPELVMPQYSYSSAAGVRYVVDVSRPIGDRVTIESLSSGEPFDPAHLYMVAINSYQAVGGGGYISEGLNWTPDTLALRMVATNGSDARVNFANYVRLNVAIFPECRNDWRVVPENWWNEARQNDLDLVSQYFIR